MYIWKTILLSILIQAFTVGEYNFLQTSRHAGRKINLEVVAKLTITAYLQAPLDAEVNARSLSVAPRHRTAVEGSERKPIAFIQINSLAHARLIRNIDRRFVPAIGRRKPVECAAHVDFRR